MAFSLAELNQMVMVMGREREREAPTDCDIKLLEFFLRAALPGWLYAAFSLTDTLGYPVWAPGHNDAWLLTMLLSENKGVVPAQNPAFITIFPTRLQTHPLHLPTACVLGGWS